MDIILKSKEEIGYMREAGLILAACHQHIIGMIKPGVSTLAVNDAVEKFLELNGATAEQKGYRGYPFATCASVNELVCHGFPSEVPLKEGDIVTIDIVVNKNGWLADSGWSYGVGEINKTLKRLLKNTEKALHKGIEQAIPGNTLGDIGHAIEKIARKKDYGIVRPLVGHGIGRVIHEPPDVPSYGKKKEGLKLVEGMVITIEPIFTIGSTGAVLWDDDGWGVRSADGTYGAQFEHTIAITQDGPYILTEI